MTYTDDQLKQAQEFVLAEWAKKENIPILKSVAEADRLFDKYRAGEVDSCRYIHLYNTKISRAMIKELVEEVDKDGVAVRDRKHFALTLQKIVHDSLPEREYYDELDLTFSTTNDLIMAFWHGEGEL